MVYKSGGGEIQPLVSAILLLFFNVAVGVGGIAIPQLEAPPPGAAKSVHRSTSPAQSLTHSRYPPHAKDSIDF